MEGGKGDHPQEKLITGNQVEWAVKVRAKAVGMTVSPHAMQASLIRLVFEGEVDLALFRTRRGIKILGQHGTIRNGETISIKTRLILSGLDGYFVEEELMWY